MVHVFVFLNPPSRFFFLSSEKKEEDKRTGHMRTHRCCPLQTEFFFFYFFKEKGQIQFHLNDQCDSNVAQRLSLSLALLLVPPRTKTNTFSTSLFCLPNVNTLTNCHTRLYSLFSSRPLWKLCVDVVQPGR